MQVSAIRIKFYASGESLNVKVSSSYVTGDLSRCFIHFEKDGINANLTFTTSDWSQHKGGRDYPEKIVIKVVQEKMQAIIQITDPVFLETRDLLEDLPLAC